jgi:hypothetical protein
MNDGDAFSDRFIALNIIFLLNYGEVPLMDHSITRHLTAKSAEQLIDINGRYRHIRPKPQLPNFAAHIEGVDLTRPLSREVQEELYQALLDFEVIFFPPQI